MFFIVLVCLVYLWFYTFGLFVVALGCGVYCVVNLVWFAIGEVSALAVYVA